MCILFVAVNQHKDYPLIIAANRDEFLNRETAQSHYWEPNHNILAGRDMVAGGTWMGINKQGYLASLTNVRDPSRVSQDAVSRGELVSQFLKHPIAHYEQKLIANKERYNGYNLLFGKWHSLAVYNNHTNEVQTLTDGYYGLSNADLNSPWPKIDKGVAALKAYCRDGHDIHSNVLFELLLDNRKPPDEELPKTGVPLEWERHVSSIFIKGKGYGTRSSTVLKVDKKHNVYWHEKTFDSDANCTASKNYNFNIN